MMQMTGRRVGLVASAVIVLVVVGAGIVSAANRPLAQPTDASLTMPSATNQPSLVGLVAGDAALARLRGRFGRHMVHGVFTLDRPKGGLITVQVDNGTVASVGSGALTITEPGGSTVTVTTNADTRARRDGSRIDLSVLKTGDEVYVLSIVPDGGGRAIARLVAAPTGTRRARPNTTPSPAASPSASG
jgi:hypothetical protein